MKQVVWTAGGVILAAALGAGGYAWWAQRQAMNAPPAEAGPPAVAAPSLAAPSPAPTAEPAIRYPLEAASAATPAYSDAWLRDTLARALGDAAVRKFIVLDDFAHRFVATVDGLPAEASAARLWPIVHTPERFLVETRPDGVTVIAPANAARYATFVAMIEAADTASVVDAYRRIYPLLQAAYETLGYPGKYFNDRVVAVIDHLLATPVLPGTAIEVRLPEINGPVQPTRPWVHYEFADPSLESRSNGQKWLLRMGHDNEARLKSKLVEIRRLLVRDAASAPAR